MEAMTEPRPELAEYHPFLLDEIQPSAREYRIAAIGTASFHVLLIGFLLLLPTHHVPPEEELPLRRVTPLVDPPLTQTARNRTPLSNQIEVPSVNIPSPKPQPSAPKKKFQAPPPSQIAKKQNPTPVVPQEPPKVIPAQPQQTAQITAPPITVQPPPKTVDQPKLVLENLPPPPSGQGNGRLKVPAGGVQEAINELARNGQTASRTVGDNTDDLAPDLSLGRTPAPTRPKSSLELLSDPKGIDFKPYLIQALQTIRMNWRSVYPESARLGARGRVVLQFAIAPDGTITKVVFTTESGSQALDRASVAAVSMSNRLPPLPAGFTGERIVLQLNFLYNAAK